MVIRASSSASLFEFSIRDAWVVVSRSERRDWRRDWRERWVFWRVVRVGSVAIVLDLVVVLVAVGVVRFCRGVVGLLLLFWVRGLCRLLGCL